MPKKPVKKAAARSTAKGKKLASVKIKPSREETVVSDRLTYRELRNTPGRVWERLALDKPLTLVADGVPKAILIPLNGEEPAEILAEYRSVRALKAMREIQAESRRNGTDKLTLDEINEIIREAREEMRSRE